MKPLFLIVCVLFGFYSGNAQAGGVGSGGGNVQLGDQVSTFQLVEAVAHAKPVLLIWLNKLEMDYHNLQAIDQCGPGKWSEKECAIYRKLFDSKPSIFAVIPGTKVETKMSAPCLDFNNQPNDGSMFGARPNSICISISNVQQKLLQDNYQNQITALLIHETSHLMGTTEDEACFLQNKILRSDLSNVPVAQATMQMYWTEGSLSWVGGLIHDLQFDTHGIYWYNGFCAQLNTILDLYYGLDKGDLTDNHYLYLTPGAYGLLWGDSLKLRALRDYTCSQDIDVDTNTRGTNLAQYNSEFEKKDLLTAPEYHGPYDSDASSTVTIQKIVDLPSWQKELAELADQYALLYDSYSKFIRDYFVTYETP